MRETGFRQQSNVFFRVTKPIYATRPSTWNHRLLRTRKSSHGLPHRQPAIASRSSRSCTNPYACFRRASDPLRRTQCPSDAAGILDDFGGTDPARRNTIGAWTHCHVDSTPARLEVRTTPTTRPRHHLDCSEASPRGTLEQATPDQVYAPQRPSPARRSDHHPGADHGFADPDYRQCAAGNRDHVDRVRHAGA